MSFCSTCGGKEIEQIFAAELLLIAALQGAEQMQGRDYFDQIHLILFPTNQRLALRIKERWQFLLLLLQQCTLLALELASQSERLDTACQ